MPKERQTDRLCVRLTPTETAKLDRLSTESGETKATIVRRLVREAPEKVRKR